MKTKLIGLGKLMRFDKPIGTFLLLWPTLTAFLILMQGSPSIDLIIIFSIGTFLMRSAGCVINDYFDKDFDREVSRTNERPLVTGEITPKEALFLFFILVSLSAFLIIMTNILTIVMAMIGLLIAIFYPLTKRFFKVPQLFLGVAFSWGILMVSTAELNFISLSSIIMFSACFFWILAYDTAYAMSDRADDLSIGLHSSAITFGNRSQMMIIIFHLLSLLLWTYLAYRENLHLVFYLGIILCTILIYHQYTLIKGADREECLKAFKKNNWVGLTILISAFISTNL